MDIISVVKNAAFRKAIEEKSYAACWSGTAEELWRISQKEYS